jgi:hypothetical protein
LRLFRTSPPDQHTAFRLPKELLATVDSICDESDLTRSQFFRRCLTERIKSIRQEQNVEMPRNIRTPSSVGTPSNVELPTKDEKRQWSPDLFERLQRRR